MLKHLSKLGRLPTARQSSRFSSTQAKISPDSRRIAAQAAAVLLVTVGVAIPTAQLWRQVFLDSPPPASNNKKSITTSTQNPGFISLQEVEKHSSAENGGVWVVIEDKVYDVSSFLPFHPGGADVIASNGGKDVTTAFAPVHPPNTLDKYASQAPLVGSLDPRDLWLLKSRPKEGSEEDDRIRTARERVPHVETMLNLDDFEKEAEKVLSKSAWAYYSGGSDDENSLRANLSAYNHIFFRPRVMRRVNTVDPSTSMLGVKTSLPVYISGAAMARLGHPEGEMNLTRGAAQKGIIQMVSSASSCSLEEINSVREQDQTLWWQFYVPPTLEQSLTLLGNVMENKMNAIFLTVDTVVLGKRESHTRVQMEGKTFAPRSDTKKKPTASAGPIRGEFDWTDVPWMRKATPGLPFVVKGVQCVEDAVLAVEAGCDGIVLSNHGGRQLDYSRAPVDVLIEIRREAPEVFDKCEVFVDGGIRRGTDVLKCIALGAKGVGLGRPFLYAQSVYGTEGVVKAIEILEQEIVTGMRLLGVTSLDQLGPEYLTLPTYSPLQRTD